MNILRCKNGHYVDADDFETCPVCGTEIVKDDVVETEPEAQSQKKLKGSWLSGKKGFFGGKMKAESAEQKHKEEKAVKDKEESDSTDEPAEDKKTEGWSRPKPEEKDVEIPQKDKGSSLKDVIKQASANEDGKTTGYFMSRYESSSESASIQSEPVVGWLVCIKGNHIGESFEVFSGKNTVGRNNSNRIVLSKDGGISREKHAYIIFDPKNTEYYLQPGDGNGLTYVNGSFVPATQKINNKDVIGLSNCELMLVSLCNEDFSWDRYIKE